MNDEVEILIADECQLVDWGESRTGGPWIKLRLPDPELLNVLRGMDPSEMKRTQHVLNLVLSVGDIAKMAAQTPHQDVVDAFQDAASQDFSTNEGVEKGLGVATPENAPDNDPEKPSLAVALHKIGFFASPAVMIALGEPEAFKRYVLRQPCLFRKGVAGVSCDGDIVAHHLRRQEFGAGMGKKPSDHYVVSLCSRHHQLLHDKGEKLFGGKEALNRKWFKLISEWGHTQLADALNIAHLSDATTSDLCDWATGEEVYHLLPKEVRNECDY